MEFCGCVNEGGWMNNQKNFRDELAMSIRQETQWKTSKFKCVHFHDAEPRL
jgi:hypothetical protein